MELKDYIQKVGEKLGQETETEEVTVDFVDRDTHMIYHQSFEMEESIANKIYIQALNYNGGEIPTGSPVYYLLDAVRSLAKLYGIKGTPDFNIRVPDDIEVYTD